jgi:tRNA nucleotidyltransferase/poly(A) polymerase
MALSEDRQPYAGRWIARLGDRIVGSGGTPQQALQVASAARFKEVPQLEYVPTSQPLSLPAQLETIRNLLPDNVETYLVGGAVRDALLGLPAHDLDFATLGEPRKLARRLAEAFHAGFFMLDDERKTARVILDEGGGRTSTLDFVVLRDGDLESDLRERDFTVNAMAVSLAEPQQLLDPMGGAADLQRKILRVCSPASLVDDPLRVLRGVRQAAQFGLHIQPDTRELMTAAVPLLDRISAERLRDELFRILDLDRSTGALRALDLLGVFPYLLPELNALRGVLQPPPHIDDVWQHTMATVRHLEKVYSVLAQGYDPESNADLTSGMMSLRLGRYREEFAGHLATPVNPNRKRLSLLKLAALLHDIAKPVCLKPDATGRIRALGHEQTGAEWAAHRARALELSNDEANWLFRVIREHMRIHLLAQTGQEPSRKAIYHYFRDCNDAGVDICLLSLADTLATYGPGLPVDVFQAELNVCRAILEAWWEKPEESVNPPILVNGGDLMAEFGVSEGPVVGKLLTAIREAQAQGSVKNRKEAFSLARQILSTDEKGA